MEENYLSEKSGIIIVKMEREKIRQTLGRHYCINGIKVLNVCA